MSIPVVFSDNSFDRVIAEAVMMFVVPYLGYLLVVGEKKASAQGGAEAQAEEVAEGVSSERMW